MIPLSIAEYCDGSEAHQAKTIRRIHDGFRSGNGLYITDSAGDSISEEQVRENLALIRTVLTGVPVDEGFVGIDGTAVRRRSFGVINEFDHPDIDRAYIAEQMNVCDGDPESLKKGLDLMQSSSKLVAAIEQNNRVLNRVIGIVMGILQQTLAIPEKMFREEILTGSTYRQRLVYYDATIGDSACGVHPDGNLLSFLLTDTKGFRYFDSEYRVHEPDVGGIICLGGSLLWRWTEGLYPPVFHYVKRMAHESKTSVVYLYNLEINKSFPTVPFGQANGTYLNDINKYKAEDIDRDGPFGDVFEVLTRNAVYG